MRSYSAIIVASSRDKSVRATVESVLGQTRPPEQTVVVVNGQGSGLPQHLREQFPEIVIYEQPDYGQGIARNTGIALATGSYLCFLDNPDLWHRDKLATVDRYFGRNPECRALSHSSWWFGGRESGFLKAHGLFENAAPPVFEEGHKEVVGADLSHDFDTTKIQGESFLSLLESNGRALSEIVVQRDLAIEAGCFSPMHQDVDGWAFQRNVARFAEWHTVSEKLAFCRAPVPEDLDSGDGLYSLGKLIETWLNGRPAPVYTSPCELLPALASHGPTYRGMVRRFLWEAVTRGDLALARLILNFGLLLLPRWKDRLLATLPTSPRPWFGHTTKAWNNEQ
jgi:glycosyltransferase involved in cell wall biosynthesis